MRPTPRQRLVPLCALLLAASGSTLRADQVWHVHAAATGANTGLSWQDAFTDLQAALGVAAPGDEIWVAAGTYRPAPANGDRDTSFALRPGVRLLGGFAGTESDAADRDWNANPTILSGDLNADDEEGFVNTAENSYHVVVAYDVQRDSVLDGFVVRAGRADGAGFGAVRESQEQGSGMNVYDASPTVRHCTFEANWSANHGSVNDHGHESVYERCTWRGNYSDMFGAGLYIHHHTAASVTDCSFFNNHARLEGAGLYSRSSAGCTVTRCLFTDNNASFGAGMYNAEGSSNTVTDCDFRDNNAIVGGGGLYSFLAFPTVTNCRFIGNAAGLNEKGGGGGGGGSGGGGIWTEGGGAVIRDCFFTANVASFGAGVYNIHLSPAHIVDCTFLANSAQEAGGVYSLNSPTIIERCQFRANVAAGADFSVGGAVSHYFSNATVRDSLFEGNSAELGGGGLYNEGESPAAFNCTFIANRAFGDTEGWGGAILNGYFTQGLIAGCSMVANEARRGGAMYNMAFATTSIRNCTVVANHASDPLPDAIAGGIASAPLATSEALNCVLWANSGPQLAGTFTGVRFACIEGGYDAKGAEHISSDAPGFIRMPSPGPDTLWGTADDDLGDLRPAPGSRLIDAGDTPGALDILTQDAGALPRFVDDPGVPDAGVGPAPVVDIGAYEFQGRSCLADFNASGAVDSQDFFDFLAAFFAGSADINRDAATNSQDFFDFLALFFAGCGR